jgi:hypothetical protein
MVGRSEATDYRGKLCAWRIRCGVPDPAARAKARHTLCGRSRTSEQKTEAGCYIGLAPPRGNDDEIAVVALYPLLCLVSAAVRIVDDQRIQEAELPDAGGDLFDLLF